MANHKTIDKQKLQTALSIIHHDDERGYYASGKFVNLFGQIQINSGTGAKYDNLSNFIRYIYQDIWNLQTIIRRLEWQKDLVINNQLDEMLWTYFAAADIRMFHVEIRSLFDYVAKIIKIISDSSVKSTTSFEKLKNWIAKSEENFNKLGPDLSSLVLSCNWFYDLREVRNSIIHDGAEALVFPIKGRILFQVHMKNFRQILIPEIMYNDNVVDFELYAGLYMGYLMQFLEELSELISKRLQLSESGTTKSYHFGLEITRGLITKVLTI